MLTAKQKFVLINLVLILACVWWIIHGHPVLSVAKAYIESFLMLNGALLIFAWINKHGI